MKEFFKKNSITILIIFATLILASIAVFTAIRLYQLRNSPVAPNVPESQPAAAGTSSCQALVFTLSSPTPTPTRTPTSTPRRTPTPTPTRTPTATPTATATARATATATATATARPTDSPTNPPTIPPTQPPTLPSTGWSIPTIIGGIGAMILLVSAFLLAI